MDLKSFNLTYGSYNGEGRWCLQLRELVVINLPENLPPKNRHTERYDHFFYGATIRSALIKALDWLESIEVMEVEEIDERREQDKERYISATETAELDTRIFLEQNRKD